MVTLGKGGKISECTNWSQTNDLLDCCWSEAVALNKMRIQEVALLFF